MGVNENLAQSCGLKNSGMTIKLLSSNKLLVDRSPPQLAGGPVIDAELSRTKADQQDKEEHVQDFRTVEEIVGDSNSDKHCSSADSGSSVFLPAAD
jgi:hypothetical protein